MSDTPDSSAVAGGLQGMARKLMEAFVDKAGAEDLLRLAELLKEAKAVEQRAEVAKDTIAANRDIALATIALRDRVVMEVVKRRLDRTDRALDAFIERLGSTEDPAEITALAQAITTVATSDSFSDLAEVVAALKSDAVELEF